MEFVVRALRAWAVPCVLPIAQAWKAFDEQGDKARQVLKAHNGYFINFYGRWTMEYMDPRCADTKRLSHLRNELDLN